MELWIWLGIIWLVSTVGCFVGFAYTQDKVEVQDVLLALSPVTNTILLVTGILVSMVAAIGW